MRRITLAQCVTGVALALMGGHAQAGSPSGSRPVVQVGPRNRPCPPPAACPPLPCPPSQGIPLPGHALPGTSLPRNPLPITPGTPRPNLGDMPPMAVPPTQGTPIDGTPIQPSAPIRPSAPTQPVPAGQPDAPATPSDLPSGSAAPTVPPAPADAAPSSTTPADVQAQTLSDALSEAAAPGAAPLNPLALNSVADQSIASAGRDDSGQGLFTPGMIGDFFSGSAGGGSVDVLQGRIFASSDGTFVTSDDIDSFSADPLLIPFFDDSALIESTLSAIDGSSVFIGDYVAETGVGQSTIVSDPKFAPPGGAGGAGGFAYVCVPLVDNAAVRDTVGGLVDSEFGPGGSLAFVPDESFTDIADDGGFASTEVNYTYDYFRPIAIALPDNLAGAPQGRVGTQKLAESTSPLPRSRVFFNHSSFNNTRLNEAQPDVRRYTPGFELAFNGGRTSVEARLPFASTIDSDLLADGGFNQRNTELGDLTLYFKQLLSRSTTFATSVGLGVSLPTSDDVTVRAGDVDLLQVEGESVHLYPFLGALFTPNDRFFAQGFVQFDFDTNGNTLRVNNGAGLEKAAVLQERNRLFLDASAGYWLYRDFGSEAAVTGFAPIAELHYNRSISDADEFVGNGLRVTGTDELDLLNGTVGATLLLRDSATLTMGYAAPLAGDEVFDGEFRVTFTQFLGGNVGRQGRAF